MRLSPPFLDHGSPAVVAHRGASRAARENTVEAFAKARALRADAVEFDVRRAADGALVVHHDPEIAELGPIVGHGLAALRELAPWVPTLDEALDACDGMWVNAEVKNLPMEPDWDPDHAVAAAVAATVRRRGLTGRVVVSSFNPGALAAVHDADPDVATALLTVAGMDVIDALEAAAGAGHVALHPHAAALAGDALSRAVERGRDLGVAVVPWTVDDPAAIRRLADAGVAGIITNVPDVARRALGAGRSAGDRSASGGNDEGE